MESTTRKRVGRPSRKKYPAVTNVRFTTKTLGQIDRLSDTYNLNRADIIRDSVEIGLKRLTERLRKRTQRQKLSDDAGLSNL